MKQFIKRKISSIIGRISQGIILKITENSSLPDTIAYRSALETILNSTNKDKNPNEIFYGISDDFWYWLLTEGSRRNSVLSNILPKFPDENTQINFTGQKGDATLLEAYRFYKLAKK